VFNLPVFLLF